MPDHAANKLVAARWAAELLGSPPDLWRILDLETSGLRGTDSEILQIGILHPDGSPLLDSYVKPRWTGLTVSSIPAEATAVNHITDAMVADAPTLVSLLPAMERELHGRRVVIYNAAFEMQMITGCLSRRAKRPEQVGEWMVKVGSWECCMDMYAQFWGQWNDYHRSYRWQKLSAHVPIAGHGAINDCRATLELLKRMAAFAQTF